MKTIIKFYAIALVAMLLLTASCQTEDEGMPSESPAPPCECIYTEKIYKKWIYEVGQPETTTYSDPVKSCSKSTDGNWYLLGNNGIYGTEKIYIEVHYKVECPK